MGKPIDFSRKKRIDRHLRYLNKQITEGMNLAEIVCVFEQMCKLPFADSAVLFETGTYSFGEDPMFNFSLVRQYPGREDEYYQLHVDVKYEPTDENAQFQQVEWESEDSNIFDYIRNSEEYRWGSQHSVCTVQVFLDET